MIAFISLKFEWLYVPMALIFIGGPLLAILMFTRIATHQGRARHASVATLLAMIGAWFAGTAFLDSVPDNDAYLTLCIALLAVGCGGWLWSIIAATRLRIWTDLLVVAIPVAMGLWAWAVE